MTAAGKRLVRWLEELGGISDARDRLTRTFLSPGMERANKRVAAWMRASGLTVREDSVGNLSGRVEARKRNAKTLLFGSHLDTVIGAGKFDGALGVLLPIMALDGLRRRGLALPFAVEVIGFSDEEGVRFSSGYLGSKGYAGQLSAHDLRRRDANGMSLREALQLFNRARFHLPKASHQPSRLIGYCEIHIEQGPVLDREGLAVGVVSAIAGQTRLRLGFRGKAGHAGTTPMRLRRDALPGAAEFVLLAESLARRTDQLMATVGAVAVSPGASNVIPDEVVLSLDVRHPRDRTRLAALRSLLAGARTIARNRRLLCTWEQKQDHRTVACDQKLCGLLKASVRSIQGRDISLASGAGHDAVIMSTLAPITMLFVRCRGGLSHHPDEYSAPADIDAALRATTDFIERLARSGF